MGDEILIIYREDGNTLIGELRITFNSFIKALNLRRLKVSKYTADVYKAFYSMRNPA